jgi:serine/threonine-protein kinase RsbW
MSKLEEVELNIPSDLRYLGAVDAVVQDLAREFSFSEKSINDISTAIIEACTNAIEHGNRFSPTKKVKVVFVFSETAIRTRIYDEGDGFDYESYLKQDNPPDLLSEKGRGLLIMKVFSDELKFNFVPSEGLCVELLKKRNSRGLSA